MATLWLLDRQTRPAIHFAMHRQLIMNLNPEQRLQSGTVSQQSHPFQRCQYDFTYNDKTFEHFDVVSLSFEELHIYP